MVETKHHPEGKRIAQSPSREKNEGTYGRKKVDEKSCVTPAGTSNELDVQNEWEENTHTHTKILKRNKMK